MSGFDEEKREKRDKLLDMDSQNMIMRDWVDVDHKMKKSGQERPDAWEGEMPDIGQAVTAFGCIGTVCDYSILKNKSNSRYERCVWIRFKDGTLLKALQSEIDMDNKEKKVQDEEFKKRLIAAGKKVEKSRKEHRARVVKGSHLVDDMLAVVSNDLTIDKKSSFYKITGNSKGKSVYLLVKGGRVDLSGFTLENDVAVNSISPEEAKKRHLGRVRGQIDFSHPDSVVMESFKAALKELNE